VSVEQTYDGLEELYKDLHAHPAGVNALVSATRQVLAARSGG
jgi:hypothetical protein